MILKNKLRFTIPEIYLCRGSRESGCPADLNSENLDFFTGYSDQDSVFTDSSYKRPIFKQVFPNKGSKRIRLDKAVVQTVTLSDFSAYTVFDWNQMGRRSHGKTNESKNLFKRLGAQAHNLEDTEFLRATPGTALLPTSFAQIALFASKKTQEKDRKLSDVFDINDGSPRNASPPIKINLDQSSSSLA